MTQETSSTQTVVITGANRGIGLAFAEHYSKQGAPQTDYEVIGLCRSSSPELDAVATRVVTGIDFGGTAYPAGIAEAMAGTSIDLLINNAGMWHNDTLDDMQLEHLAEQMAINAYAPIKTTTTLLPFLSPGAKIAMITSRMGSLADNTSGGRYGYRASKAALNAFSKSLAIDLKPQGFPVAILHPGYVQTRMVGFGGDVSTEQSVAGLVQRIQELNLENTGTFWHANGEELPW